MGGVLASAVLARSLIRGRRTRWGRSRSTAVGRIHRGEYRTPSQHNPSPGDTRLPSTGRPPRMVRASSGRHHTRRPECSTHLHRPHRTRPGRTGSAQRRQRRTRTSVQRRNRRTTCSRGRYIPLERPRRERTVLAVRQHNRRQFRTPSTREDPQNRRTPPWVAVHPYTCPRGCANLDWAQVAGRRPHTPPEPAE